MEQSLPANKHLTKHLHCAHIAVQTPANHGFEPQSKLCKHSEASCGVLYPPLCGIVHLANTDVLCFQYWSFTIKYRLSCPLFVFCFF